MFRTTEQLIAAYPNLRRYIASGFRYRPERDAPTFGMVFLESANQRLFVETETGIPRAAAAQPR